MGEKGTVCVTGAGGYVASWLVKLLLSNGYTVHGTVRDPQNDKNAHLKKLEKASENLKLFKADLLDYNSLSAAITGCDGVFHVACPVPSGSVPNPEARIPRDGTYLQNHLLARHLVFALTSEPMCSVPCCPDCNIYGVLLNPDCLQVELVEPAVKGTLNVLKACSEANVKRVVVVSSVAAVVLSPDWPKGRVKDESCWSDKEYCRRTNVILKPNDCSVIIMDVFFNWYCLSKTEAESEAIEFAKVSGLDVVTVCPSLVLGPMLQPMVNSSSLVLIKLLKGYEELENSSRYIVDARDVAEALLLAYEKPEAKGRYICTAHTIRSQDLVEILRRLYPNYNYPKKFTEANEGEGLSEGLSSEKLQELGWSYRPLEETLVDSIEGYREAGHLD
ncbi:hypothetical protein RHSIM_Rhsim06G0002800 [Rhododendron simsii]|uniref:NAD(P)-binding domain-containing protein n=1 Tax=Rhododendron simsii TaxID=118357 RepID=A0A834LIE6_RHOSS|nr:hypothetical protein RHSIM_Rhsim06G0002800 [Rhododendron simsii]